MHEMTGDLSSQIFTTVVGQAIVVFCVSVCFVCLALWRNVLPPFSV